jgi:hypothetical protein
MLVFKALIPTLSQREKEFFEFLEIPITTYWDWYYFLTALNNRLTVY